MLTWRLLNAQRLLTWRQMSAKRMLMWRQMDAKRMLTWRLLDAQNYEDLSFFCLFRGERVKIRIFYLYRGGQGAKIFDISKVFIKWQGPFKIFTYLGLKGILSWSAIFLYVKELVLLSSDTYFLSRSVVFCPRPPQIEFVPGNHISVTNCAWQ